MILCENGCPLEKFGGCCHSCPEADTCPEACEEDVAACDCATFDEESGLVAFRNSQIAILNQIATLTTHKKALEEQEKTMKAALYEAMEKFGIKKFESDILNLTMVAPTTAVSVDSAKLKKKFPEVYAECSKTTAKSGYVKITLKDDGK